MKTRLIEICAAYRDNELYRDYLAGTGSARDFFTHEPLDFAGALRRRREGSYPRRAIADALLRYNDSLGADERALRNIRHLTDECSLCIITGQQAGFLGGPVYTLYKIVTALRLAAHCTDTLGIPVVPVFWLASDDHDLHEVNHAYVYGADGEVQKVQFPVEHNGRPVESITVTTNIIKTYKRYFDLIVKGAFAVPLNEAYIAEAREAVPPPGGERFSAWVARTWSALFSHHGLVLVEPAILRVEGGPFLETAVRSQQEMELRIAATGDALRAAGYEPAALSPETGKPFFFDESGRRVRAARPGEHADAVMEHPERYSADVLLRPLMADSILPTLAHVLGPGEFAYHAYMKPLYELLGMRQPLLFPRKSYTVLRSVEEDRLKLYHRTAEDVLRGRGAGGEAFSEVLPDRGRLLFDEARAGIEEAIAPLGRFVEEVDPNLMKTHQRLESNAKRALDVLRDRAVRSLMSRSGLSKGEYRRLANIIMPKGRLQERVYPLPFVLALAGRGFLDAVIEAGELLDFSHVLITVEADGE
jgi:bacillithiol biosynthesis cysteine-adding enzyme BshC